MSLPGFFYFETMETKKELRRAVALKKKKQLDSDLQTWSDLLLSKLEKHPLFQKAHTLLLYHSLPDEVRTHHFVERWSKEKTLILPVVKGDVLELRHYTGKQDLKKGSFGIEEPTGALLEDYSQIELAIIPGVSFDGKGNRLGREKGTMTDSSLCSAHIISASAFSFKSAKKFRPKYSTRKWMKYGLKTAGFMLTENNVNYYL